VPHNSSISLFPTLEVEFVFRWILFIWLDGNHLGRSFFLKVIHPPNDAHPAEGTTKQTANRRGKRCGWWLVFLHLKLFLPDPHVDFAVVGHDDPVRRVKVAPCLARPVGVSEVQAIPIWVRWLRSYSSHQPHPQSSAPFLRLHVRQPRQMLLGSVEEPPFEYASR